jgi:hypothetical protein
VDSGIEASRRLIAATPSASEHPDRHGIRLLLPDALKFHSQLPG